MSVYTDDQLLQGIHNALKVKDLEAAAILTKQLAYQAPDKAQVILDATQGKVTFRVKDLQIALRRNDELVNRRTSQSVH